MNMDSVLYWTNCLLSVTCDLYVEIMYLAMRSIVYINLNPICVPVHIMYAPCKSQRKNFLQCAKTLLATARWVGLSKVSNIWCQQWDFAMVNKMQRDDYVLVCSRETRKAVGHSDLSGAEKQSRSE